MNAVAARTPGNLQGIVLLLPVTLAVMGISVLVPVVPQLIEQFKGVPNGQYLVMGGILTMPALCIMLFSGPAGWFADRFGRRRVLIGAMIVYAFLGMAPMVLEDLTAIIVSRIGVGICEAVIVTVSTTLISDYFRGAERQRWLGNQAAVGALSSLVLIAAGGFLGSAYGWHGTFAIYAVSLPLALLVWRFTWEPDADDDRAEALVDPTALGRVTAEFPWARLIGICAITLFMSVMFYTLQTQTGIALGLLGLTDPARIGIYIAIATLGVPAGTFAFRRLARMPIALLLFIEFLAIGIGFTGMGLARTPEAYVATALINQFGCGMILPTLLTWATGGLAFDIRGRGNGMWQATFAVGQFLSGLTVTLLAAGLGGLQPAFVALGIANAVVAAIAVVALTRYRASIAAADGEMVAV